MSKIKVLMLGVSKKNKGGMWTVAENYIYNKKLKEKVDLDYEATITKNNIVFKFIFILFKMLKIKMKMKKNKYDIVHINMSERGSVFRTGFYAKQAKKNKAKVIIHMHGAEFQSWYEDLNEKRKIKVKQIINYSNKILILGEYWREFLESIVDDKKKISVLYNAVIIPKKISYNDKSKNVLYLGLVGKRKGILDVIESIKLLKKQNVEFKLIVFGPDETSGFQEIINNNDLNDYIEYKGWLNNKDKITIFENIKGNILPSYNEGLPMTILETMSYGIPNITTPVAAIPEVVNSTNGFIVEPGNILEISEALKNLINNSQIEKSKKCHNLIKNQFSLEKHIEKLVYYYTKVLEAEK